MSPAQDKPLSLRDRIRLRLHIQRCIACQRHERQLSLLRKIMRRYN
jgi:hypothetical protein